ncbi:response regulator transcription factor [Paenibacillus glycanilyticus]|uniref:response regulator transcription factor n=1 Tax=Paenibacillus glycanilyticus TaxID=126569 RepID=UPI0013E30C7D|nr:response regulator [Paenibacillus glycanilyticus]
MSYQLLLVDDEIHAIEGVKSDLALDKLGISKLFTAYSMKQAKQVFSEEAVDILLCDIEMPQGSGLELLSWVREEYPNTATIFLTSHADFKYAKEAMQLGSVDYLLKPVLVDDLEAAIRKAQGVIDRNSEMSRNSEFHQLWLSHHSLIIERFWLDLIHQSIPSHPDAIRRQVELQHLPIGENSMFLPVLITVQRWKKELKRRDEKIMEYALKNSAEEMIIGNHGNGICFPLERGELLIILAGNQAAEWDEERLMQACREYIDCCNRYFYCEISCYLGQPAKTFEIADMVGKQRLSDRNNVAFHNQVFPYGFFKTSAAPPGLIPSLSSLSFLLKNGKKEDVIQEACKLIDELVCKQEMNADNLHRFHQDFLQGLYSFLHARGVQAHQLFGDQESQRLSDSADRSVTDMLAWVHYAVNKAMHQAEAVKESDSVVETVRRYIAINMDQDLSRETIAEQVFLNPDYLSRMFKKETGHSVSDYILLERIRAAKEMLSQTSVPISTIAASVGYTNFSHFAKIFKKYAGIGPSEYRNQYGNG